MRSSLCRSTGGQHPKLSILLATRNQAHFLEKCLQGIRDQLFSDYEFLILNDGSTDRTSAILAQWAQQDPRIRIFDNHGSLGVIGAYKALQQKAMGEYIWHAASDDFCVDKAFLENGFLLLRTYPNSAGFFCNTLRIMEPGGVPHGIWGAKGGARYIRPDNFLSNFLKGKLVVPGCASVFKREPFLALGGFHRQAGPLCDLLAGSLMGSLYGMVFVARLSMNSTVYSNRKGFSSSTDPWVQLDNLAFFEHVLKMRTFSFQIKPSLWSDFRYLFLSSFFNIEHLARNSKKDKIAKKELEKLCGEVFQRYAHSLKQLESPIIGEFSSKTLSRFPFRRPVERFLQKKILKFFFKTQEVSL